MLPYAAFHQGLHCLQVSRMIRSKIFWLAHKMLVLNAYVQKSPSNAHAEVTSGARGLKFILSLLLLPKFVYARSKAGLQIRVRI